MLSLIFLYIDQTYKFRMFCRVIFRKIFRNIFLSCSPCNKKNFKLFWSKIQKYLICIAGDWCCLIVSFSIIETFVFYVNNFLMGCGWTISSNVIRIMMISLPVMKNPPVSDYTAEAATHFKMLPFTCIASFRLSCAHFEGVLSKKIIF